MDKSENNSNNSTIRRREITNNGEFLRINRLIFGGSFDPPHLGHLEILRYILKNNPNIEIDLIPAFISPFKQGDVPSASTKDRLCMLEELICSFEEETALHRKPKQINLLDLELKRGAPSYTSETCRIIRAKYPNQEIGILIGADSLAGLEFWHKIEELLFYHSFWVHLREGFSKEKIEMICSTLCQKFRKYTPRIQIFWNSSIISCSSSDLRHLLLERKGTNVDKEIKRYIIPRVLKYIENRSLDGLYY